jgi:hypothetical protein
MFAHPMDSSTPRHPVKVVTGSSKTPPASPQKQTIAEKIRQLMEEANALSL